MLNYLYVCLSNENVNFHHPFWIRHLFSVLPKLFGPMVIWMQWIFLYFMYKHSYSSIFPFDAHFFFFFSGPRFLSSFRVCLFIHRKYFVRDSEKISFGFVVVMHGAHNAYKCVCILAIGNQIYRTIELKNDNGIVICILSTKKLHSLNVEQRTLEWYTIYRIHYTYI